MTQPEPDADQWMRTRRARDVDQPPMRQVVNPPAEQDGGPSPAQAANMLKSGVLPPNDHRPPADGSNWMRSKNTTDGGPL